MNYTSERIIVESTIKLRTKVRNEIRNIDIGGVLRRSRYTALEYINSMWYTFLTIGLQRSGPGTRFSVNVLLRAFLKYPDCGQTLLIHTDNRNPNRDLLDKTYYQCTTYRKKGANKPLNDSQFLTGF